MAISIKTSEEIEKMRVAGRLAAEVLEMIEPSLNRASAPANWIASVTTISLTSSRPFPPASATTVSEIRLHLY
jgi:methionine aminopeptidase